MWVYVGTHKNCLVVAYVGTHKNCLVVAILMSNHMFLWRIRENYWWYFRDNFPHFSIKTYVVGTHYEAILMSTHNICSYGELEEIFPKLSSNTYLIWFTALFAIPSACSKPIAVQFRDTAQILWYLQHLFWVSMFFLFLLYLETTKLSKTIRIIFQWTDSKIIIFWCSNY